MKTQHLRTWMILKKNLLVIVFLMLCIGIAVLTPTFLSLYNLRNVAIQIAINILLATGMTFIIISGGIDISVGSVAALSAVVISASVKMFPNAGILLILLITFVMSGVIGCITGGINGFAVTQLNISPFIATLSMMSIARGAAFVFTNGKPIFDLPNAFQWLGQDFVFFIPVVVVLVLVVMLVAHVLLDKTVFGKYVYAIGSNETAARLNGIRTQKVKMQVYIIVGILSALAGAVLASRLGAGQPSAALGYELTAIAAVVMGGTHMTGGSGNIPRTFLGVLTIGVINNGLSLMRVSSYWQPITIGIIIMAFVATESTKKKR